MKFSTTEDVTPDLVDAAMSIVDTRYTDVPDRQIDWEDVWDKLEYVTLPDGSDIDLGGELDSPALKEVKRAVRKRRKEID